jgi:mRNA-degrading endonuclease toxin of MazEF toxin-antitoxin module
MMRHGEIWTANLNPSRGREIGKMWRVTVLAPAELAAFLSAINDLVVEGLTKGLSDEVHVLYMCRR